MSIIITNADMPTNPLWRNVDAFLQAAGGSSRAEILGFFKQEDDGGQVFLFGDNLAAVLEGEKLVLFRKVADRTMPPISTLLANAAGAAGRAVRSVAKGERVLVSDEAALARIKVCETCVHLENGMCKDVKLENGTVEKGCGCRVNVKARLKDESCPQGLWK